MNNQFEKEAIDTAAPVMTDVKQVTDAPAPVPPSAPDATMDELDVSPTFIEQGKNILIGLTVTPKLLYVIHHARFEECLFFHLILITVKS